MSVRHLFNCCKMKFTGRQRPRRSLPTFGRQASAENLEIRLVPATTGLGIIRGTDWLLDTDRVTSPGGTASHEIDLTFGLSGDVFLVGSWNGAGSFPAVVRQPGTNGAPANGLLHWYFDNDGDSAWETHLEFGVPGDIPIVGDWDGDGRDNMGVVRRPGGLGMPSDGLLHWLFDTNGDSAFEREQRFGFPEDTPVVGNWNNAGPDDVGVVRKDLAGALHWLLDSTGSQNPLVYIDRVFGSSSEGDVPVVGDWDGVNGDDYGVMRQRPTGVQQWRFNIDSDAEAEFTRDYGLPGDLPVPGAWSFPEIAVDGVFSGQTTPVEFGTVSASETGAIRTLTIRNPGTSDLRLSRIDVAAAAAGQPVQFQLLDTPPAVLRPGQSWSFRLKMIGLTTGTKAGVVTIVNNDGNEGSFRFSVRGSVVSGGAEITVLHSGAILTDGISSIDFGSVAVGSAAETRTFMVRNDGNAALSLQAPTLPAGLVLTAPFTVTSLLPGRSLTFSVRMATSAARVISGDLIVRSNDADEAVFSVNLTGAVYSAVPQINGELFNDRNRNETKDTGEPLLPNRGVFADLNRNGRYDTGEPKATTDAQGKYQIVVPRAEFASILPQTTLAGESPQTTSRGYIFDVKFVSISGGVHTPDGQRSFRYGTPASGGSGGECVVAFVAEPALSLPGQGTANLGQLSFRNFETQAGTHATSAVLVIGAAVGITGPASEIRIPLTITTRPNQNPPVPEDADTISLSSSINAVRVTDPTGAIYELSQFRFQPVDADPRSTPTELTVNELAERRVRITAQVQLVGMNILAEVVQQQLRITGTENADRIRVSEAGGQITVIDIPSGRSLPVRFLQKVVTTVPASAVQNIRAEMLGGDDVVHNSSTKPSEQFGGAGNDHLFGGSPADILRGDAGDDLLAGLDGTDTLWGGLGDDVLYGGNQRDFLYGEDGNDSLVGHDGNDVLSGGAGLDMLFGGAGADTLRGDTGADRFLVQTGDSVTDSENADARISFVNGGATWSDNDILKVDEGFSRLVNRIGNTRLLKMPDGRQLSFERWAFLDDTDPVFADNNSQGRIRFADLAFTTDQQVDPVWSTTIHELAHNWDELRLNSATNPVTGRPFVSDFQRLSFWRLENDGQWTHAVGAGFVSGYADTNPYEDFAETVVAVFLSNSRYRPQDAPDKVNLLRSWLETLKS